MVAALRGQTFTTIANFGGNLTSPTTLILGPDGNFYGAAASPSNVVTLFQMTPAGTLASLAAIGTGAGSAQLLAGQDGNIYLLAQYGGETGQGGVRDKSPLRQDRSVNAKGRYRQQ